jgi:hypothetical protein
MSASISNLIALATRTQARNRHNLGFLQAVDLKEKQSW